MWLAVPLCCALSSPANWIISRIHSSFISCQTQSYTKTSLERESSAYSMVGLRAALCGGRRVPLSAMNVLPALSTGHMVQCHV